MDATAERDKAPEESVAEDMTPETAADDPTDEDEPAPAVETRSSSFSCLTGWPKMSVSVRTGVAIIFTNPLPFIKAYVEALNGAVMANAPGRKLSHAQRVWLKFCLMGVLLTNTVCWKALERAGLGGYRLGALSWMFRHSKVAWDGLLRASVALVLRRHGIMEGVLVADASDHRRAKRTRRIWQAHKVFDKKTGGYFRFRGREWSLADYFRAYPGVTQCLRIRGGEAIEAVVGSARRHVCAHGKKRFVVALKYPGETEYRFLVATDLSWRTLDLVRTHTLRWLVEVFFEDWKLYEGWGQMAKQPGAEGSSRSLTLSLLLDHALLLHPEQCPRLENQRPACTVGSLRQLSQGEAMLDCVRSVLSAENVAERLA